MTFKIIIAGGRNFGYKTTSLSDGTIKIELDIEVVNRAHKHIQEIIQEYKLHSGFEIVSGAAKGADEVGELYASHKGSGVIKFHAEWNKHGKKAGILRNIQMSKYADSLIAFWDGESRGTKHMIDTMRKLGKPVKVIRYANI